MQLDLDDSDEFMTDATSRGPAEVNIISLFQSDTLAPHQYHQTLRRKVCQEPEHKLMFAVLEDAICCFQRYASARDKMGTRLYLEARNWIMEEDCDWPFSFANICGVFGLSPQYIRAGLQRHQDRKLAKVYKGKVCQFTTERPRKKRAQRRQSASRLSAGAG